MEVSRIRALRGPNLWTRHTAIEVLVQCLPEHADISALPRFESRLRNLFPGMGSLKPTETKAKVSLAHALESATLHLQTEAGCPVTFSRTTPTPDVGLYQVVIEYTEESVGRLALKLARELVQAALDDGGFDLDAALVSLRTLDEDIRLGPSTGSIVDAAVARGIPFRRLTDGSLVQFGWGSKQRRIQAAEIDRTSAIAESIAQDKELTKKLLDAAGVPVPKGRPVKDAEDAWVAAQHIGLPVVIKPRDGNQGKGVTVNISVKRCWRPTRWPTSTAARCWSSVFCPEATIACSWWATGWWRQLGANPRW
jgi:cyanophycin synthetase